MLKMAGFHHLGLITQSKILLKPQMESPSNFVLKSFFKMPNTAHEYFYKILIPYWDIYSKVEITTDRVSP